MTVKTPVKQVEIPCYCWQEKKGAKSGALHCTEPPGHGGRHYHWPSRTRW